MTVKKLEEFKKKFIDKKGDVNDLGEVLTDFFQTFSNYAKDLKKQNEELIINQDILFEEISELKKALNPVYTIVYEEND
jgi:hypothetical protein